MFYERKEDLAIVYWLKNILPPEARVEDGFPEKILSLPTVAVEWVELEKIERELGERSGFRQRTWHIDIFAKNKSQRDEYAYLIYNALKDGINVYNIVNGSPTQEIIGHLNILARRVITIPVDATLIENLYYRARIEILAENDLQK